MCIYIYIYYGLLEWNVLQGAPLLIAKPRPRMQVSLSNRGEVGFSPPPMLSPIALACATMTWYWHVPTSYKSKGCILDNKSASP